MKIEALQHSAAFKANKKNERNNERQNKVAYTTRLVPDKSKALNWSLSALGTLAAGGMLYSGNISSDKFDIRESEEAYPNKQFSLNIMDSQTIMLTEWEQSLEIEDGAGKTQITINNKGIPLISVDAFDKDGETLLFVRKNGEEEAEVFKANKDDFEQVKENMKLDLTSASILLLGFLYSLKRTREALGETKPKISNLEIYFNDKTCKNWSFKERKSATASDNNYILDNIRGSYGERLPYLVSLDSQGNTVRIMRKEKNNLKEIFKGEIDNQKNANLLKIRVFEGDTFVQGCIKIHHGGEEKINNRMLLAILKEIVKLERRSD